MFDHMKRIFAFVLGLNLGVAVFAMERAPALSGLRGAPIQRKAPVWREALAPILAHLAINEAGAIAALAVQRLRVRGGRGG